jgi:uncharacterized membrane protein YuzA (DUF378 family)
MSSINWVAFILTVIGGLNWGLVGAFNGFDLVAKILGEGTIYSNIVYVLVGLSALYLLIERLMKTNTSGAQM